MSSTPEARREELMAITCRDVQSAAERVFRAQNLNLIAVGLLPRRAQQALAQQVQAFD
jgi:hypothetical protein